MGSMPQGPLALWHLQEDGESRDIYDRHLTQAEIQGHVSHANGKRDSPVDAAWRPRAEGSGCPRGLGRSG